MVTVAVPKPTVITVVAQPVPEQPAPTLAPPVRPPVTVTRVARIEKSVETFGTTGSAAQVDTHAVTVIALAITRYECARATVPLVPSPTVNPTC